MALARPAPLHSYRLKIACGSEREFRELFAPKYVSTGVFIPSRDPKAIGTRVRVKFEFRDGQVPVSGEAMVTSRMPEKGAGRPGMTLRLTALDPDSIQFELSPSAARAPASAVPAPPLALESNLEDLFALDAEPIDTAVSARTDALSKPAPTSRAVPAREQEPREVDDTMVLDDAAPPPAPEPPTSQQVRRSPAPGGVDERRLAMLVAVALLVLVAVVLTVALRGSRQRAPDATLTSAARVDEELRLTDARLMEGRLTGAGGDSALDHLLAARAAAPEDARVTTRTGLLADKFEELGGRALARGNLREAAVHYEAAVRADPSRESARRKLAETMTAPDGAAPAR